LTSTIDLNGNTMSPKHPNESMPSYRLSPSQCKTISIVMIISSFRQASFPGKYCPWNLKEHCALDVSINALSPSTSLQLKRGPLHAHGHEGDGSISTIRPNPHRQMGHAMVKTSFRSIQTDSHGRTSPSSATIRTYEHRHRSTQYHSSV